MSECPSVTATKVTQSRRIKMLPKYFGERLMVHTEHAIYDTLQELAPEYNGGFWHYFELSNGGFYMSPDLHISFDVTVNENGFSDTMSADAAGITACLFTYSQLANAKNSEQLSNLYHLLREFALDHPESAKILAAID